jgi:DNA-binding NarL/FixJ family response regulator
VALVAVADPLPLFRAGAEAVLVAEGHEVESPVDLLGWARSRRRGVLVITLDSEEDWAVLGQVDSLGSEVFVVALLTGFHPFTGARAVHAGAHSVLRRDSPVQGLAQAVAAAENGVAVLPAEVVQDLRVPGEGVSSRSPTPAQLSWLQALAAGSTVTELAEQAGYSERAMYRMLQRLYAQLGVRTRTEALIHAQSSGWLAVGRKTG